ncbi:ABC transporter permease [Acrocarpospora catenulata]|uniref:ABC transporter permease n=1 Tax=Acrocarpospora catenulata TaxID=2836182 RepID=UPI0020239746|nr:ABC transporter permease [Acrocarpospora catenulata]
MSAVTVTEPVGERRQLSDRWPILLFIVRRLAAMVVMLALVSFLVFSLVHLAPGNPVDALLGQKPRTPETVAALTAQFHLDRPFLEQYAIWASGALRFDFGTAIQSGLPVMTQIASRLPVSIALGIFAFLLTMIVGVGLGILAAMRRGRTADRVTTASVVVGLSTPTFVAAILLLYVFAVLLSWFPAYGKGSGGLDTLWHLTLPAIALALGSCAYVVKHTRAAMIDVLDQDYITFARARGLSRTRILLTYSLRNALIPVITIGGVVLGGLIVGAVLVEVTFSIQGIGQLLVQSAGAKDLPVIQGVTMLIGVLIISINLCADVIYMLVDPRLRLGRR